VNKKVPSLKSFGLPPSRSLEERRPSTSDQTDISTLTKDEKLALFLPVCSKIDDNIFVGSVQIASNKTTLLENNVTHILNCAGVIIPNYFPDDFVYKTLHLFDGRSQDITSMSYEVLEYIESVLQSGGTIFIHCEKGVSRSCSMLIMYKMWKNRVGFITASEDVKAKRPICQPNDGFLRQILLWWKRSSEPVTLDGPPRLYRISPDSVRSPSTFVARYVASSPQHAPPTAAQLDPRGAFVLHTYSHLFVWCGPLATDEMRHHALLHAERLRRFERVTAEVTHVSSSDADPMLVDAFWAALGGKRDPIEPVAAYDAEYRLLLVPRGPFLWRYDPSAASSSTSTDAAAAAAATAAPTAAVVESPPSSPTPTPLPADQLPIPPSMQHLDRPWRLLESFDRSTLANATDDIFMLHDNMRLFLWIGPEVASPDIASLIASHEAGGRDVPPKDTPVQTNYAGKESPQFWTSFSR